MTVLAILLASASARAEDDPTEQARRHFMRGSEFFEKKAYANAIEEFEAGRKAVPGPEFDYNIGVCHDRLDHWREAVEAYQRYVAASPPDAAEIRVRIAKLKEHIPPDDGHDDDFQPVGTPPARSPTPATAPPAPTPPPQPAAAPPKAVTAPPAAAPTPGGERLLGPALGDEPAAAAATPIHRKWWLWAIVGGGVVLAGAGLGLGLGLGLSGGATAVPGTTLGSMTLGFH